MEQQIDDPFAPGHLGDKAGDGGSYAPETGQGCEKWVELDGVHGLTASRAGIICHLAKMTEQEPAESPDPSAARRRRMLFRATHRGTYENDLMVGGFVRAHVEALSDSEMDALEAVMELPDPILADWLSGREPIPEHEQTPMLLRMKEFLLR